MLVHIYHTTQHHITEDGNLEKGDVFWKQRDITAKVWKYTTVAFIKNILPIPVAAW